MFFQVFLQMKLNQPLNYKMKLLLILFVLFFFNPLYALTISQSVKSTIDNNPKVQISIEKLNESKELIENAYGQKLPSITTTISGTYSNADKSATTGDTTPETLTDKYKLSLSQNLYDGGINNLEINRSQILYNNEILKFQNTLQELILNAIEGYLTVINYKESLEANKKNYDSVLRVLEETKTRFELGSATLYDLQSAESAFSIAETNLFIADQNYLISKKTFKRIVGEEPLELQTLIDLNEDLIFKNVISNVNIKNYNLLILKNEISNKKILLEKEKNTKLPSLDLSASAEYSNAGRMDDGTESTDGTIALTLTIPIFQQNIDNSNIRKYNSQILQSELNVEDYLADLDIETSNLFKNYLISKSSIKTNLKRIDTIETSIEIIKEEYDIGTKSITDLIDAESDLLDVNVTYLNAKKDYILNYFKIKALEGNLLELFKNYIPTIN